MGKVIIRSILVMLVGYAGLVYGMKKEDDHAVESKSPSDTECTLAASLREAACYMRKQFGVKGVFSNDCILTRGGRTVSYIVFTPRNGIKKLIRQTCHKEVEALIFTACTRPCSLLLKTIMAGWTQGDGRVTPEILRNECHALHDRTPLDYIYMQYGKSSTIYKIAIQLLNDWKNLARHK